MAIIKLPVHAILTQAELATTAAIKDMLAAASEVYASIELVFELASSEIDADPALAMDSGPLGIEPLQIHIPRASNPPSGADRLVLPSRYGRAVVHVG